MAPVLESRDETARRHHHGLVLRLGDDAPRGGHAHGAVRAIREPRHLRAPHPGPADRVHGDRIAERDRVEPADHPLAAKPAIRFQRAHDWDRVRSACHELLRQAQAQIADMAYHDALTDLRNRTGIETTLCRWWQEQRHQKRQINAVLMDLVHTAWPPLYGEDRGDAMILRTAIAYFLPAAAAQATALTQASTTSST